MAEGGQTCTPSGDREEVQEVDKSTGALGGDRVPDCTQGSLIAELRAPYGVSRIKLG